MAKGVAVHRYRTPECDSPIATVRTCPVCQVEFRRYPSRPTVCCSLRCRTILQHASLTPEQRAERAAKIAASLADIDRSAQYASIRMGWRRRKAARMFHPRRDALMQMVREMSA